MNESTYYPPIHVEYRRHLAAKKARRLRRRARRGQGRMGEWRQSSSVVASS